MIIVIEEFKVKIFKGYKPESDKRSASIIKIIVSILLALSIVILLLNFFSCSGDGEIQYKRIVDTPIEEVSDFDGYSTGFTDLAAHFSFKSNKFIRIKDIEKYKSLTYETSNDSLIFSLKLDNFKRIFKHETLDKCDLNDVIMKEYYEEKTTKTNSYTQTIRRRIEYVHIKNKGLYFFMYSSG